MTLATQMQAEKTRETTVQPTSTPPWERQPAADLTPAPAPDSPRRASVAKRAAAIGATSLAIVLAGWIGVAVADNSDPTTTTTPPAGAPAAPGALPPKPGGPHGGFRGFGPAGKGGPGGRGAVHGQFTVPNGSGFRTIDQQAGEVTAVSHDSISVKSPDGFTNTYSVTDNTLVNAGRDGIGSVKTGDKVNVDAIEHDGTVEAVNINDQTTNSAIHDHWKPAPPPGKTPPTTTP